MRRALIPALLLAIPLTAPFTAAEKLKPEELIKHHQEAQFAGAAQPPDRERIARGPCTLTSPAKGAGALEGSFSLSSGPQASTLVLQFPSDVYTGENVAFTDGNVTIGFGQPRTSARSALGLFLATNRVIVSEGLLGGVLNARWPLLDATGRQAKLTYDGMKKQGGRELHRLRYRAKQGQGDLEIFLFFEPDTYRHVTTLYSSSRAQAMGATPETSSQRSETYFRLEESFSDFQQAAGLTVPKSWTLRYERSGDTTSEWKYDFKVGS